MIKLKVLITTSLLSISSVLQANNKIYKDLFYEDNKYNENNIRIAMNSKSFMGKDIDIRNLSVYLITKGMKGSASAQEISYNFCHESIGDPNTFNDAKKSFILNLCLNNSQGWAYRIKAQQLDKENKLKEAKSFYNDATCLGDQLCRARADELFEYNRQKTYNLFNDCKKLNLKSGIDKYIKEWEKKGYIVPILELAQYFENKNFIDKALTCYTAAADKKCVEAQFKVADLVFKNSLFNKLSQQEAVNLYLKAAQQGHIQAQFELGHHVERSPSSSRLIHEKKLIESYRWYLQAAKQGHAEAQFKVGSLRALGLVKNQGSGPETAFKWYLRAANQGNKVAQYNIGSYKEQGLEGQEINLEEAFNWFYKSAQQGFFLSQYIVGDFIINGRGGQKVDENEALRWYLKAAEQGDAKAQSKSAYILLKNSKDRHSYSQQVFDLLSKSAHQGLPAAQLNFGHLFTQYSNDPRFNLDKGLKWYLKAAEQGDAQAQFNVAYLLDQKQNFEEAHKWYLKAAEQSYTKAQYNLASTLLKKQNFEEAHKWYLKAAEQGDAQAQFNIGCLLMKNQDFEEAHKWYRKSAKQKNMLAQHNLGTSLIKNQTPDTEINNEAVENLINAANQGFIISMSVLGDYYINFEEHQEDALFWLQKAKALGSELSQKHLDLIEKANQIFINSKEDEILVQKIDQITQEILNLLEINLDQNELQFESMASSQQVLDKIQENSIEEFNDLSFVDENSDLESYPLAENSKYKLKSKYKQIQIISKLIKSRKEEDQENLVKLSHKNAQIAKEIMEGNTDIRFSDLVKVLQDHAFKGQIYIKNTKSGFNIIVHNRFNNKHGSASTHFNHLKNKNILPKEFISNVKDLLKIFIFDKL